MNEGRMAGFERRRLPGDGIEIDALVGGSGPPLLLLHGYPQTRLCWAAVAPALLSKYTVVIPDLRGYGRSDKPVGGGDHAAYSKRTMAKDQIATMAALGHLRFAVASHDRGARVGYRLALDHPDSVSHLAVMDIVPTADVWSTLDAKSAVRMWHWSLQAQEDGLPEMLINGNPDFFLKWVFAHQAPGFAFDAASLEDYLACARDPETVHGFCEDYRAGWTIDRAIDEADRGKKTITAPLLVLWGEKGNVAEARPLETWRTWASDVRGHAVPGAHFCPEEAPDAVIAALEDFLPT